MKRLVMPICIPVLMLNLSADGHIGNAKFVDPNSTVESLQVSAQHYGSEASDCHHEIL
jgi:hypothetical protein